MNENANKIQMVLDTLQQIDIKATYDNCRYMLGCLDTLSSVRDSLIGISPCDSVQEVPEEKNEVEVEVIGDEQ